MKGRSIIYFRRKKRGLSNQLVTSLIRFIVVPEDKTFKFKKLCPYCGGDLTYTCNGWEQDDYGKWMADSFDMECSTEPDIESDEWEDWFSTHSELPYTYQLPVDERVKRFINNKYRFDLKDNQSTEPRTERRNDAQ